MQNLIDSHVKSSPVVEQFTMQSLLLEIIQFLCTLRDEMRVRLDSNSPFNFFVLIAGFFAL